MGLKFDTIRVDASKQEEGEWIASLNLPGVEFRVSPLHKPAFVMARERLALRLAKKFKREPVPPDDRLVEVGRLLAQHILHGWRGFDVEYTAERAAEALTDPSYRVLIGEVENCAARAGEPDLEFEESDTGNSQRPSSGS